MVDFSIVDVVFAIIVTTTLAFFSFLETIGEIKRELAETSV